jgi:hypothetical protein
VVLVDSATLNQAEQLIESCKHCNSEGAEIPFDNILDRVTGSDPSVTDYESAPFVAPKYADLPNLNYAADLSLWSAALFRRQK